MQRLGIIAGAGSLPRLIADACLRRNTPFYVLALKGQAQSDALQDLPHDWIDLGATDRGISMLKSHGVDTLVLAGGVRRPTLMEIKPDLRTIKVFMRLGGGAFGDDSLLQIIRGELEGEGFTLIGAHDIAPELLTPAGILTKKTPGTADKSDIAHGITVTRTLGQVDVGQAAVIQNGLTLAVEAIEGTDALLIRAKSLKRKGGGGVLVKTCKPQQDKRLDLPTIGPRTVARAAEAGLNGIAVEAGASLIVERAETIAAADKLGLFIHGF
jgi:hypothetical protein